MIHKTKQCDICGKKSGVELKESDFIKSSGTQIKLKNWKGDDISISFNLKINTDKNDPDKVLADSMKTYSQFDHFLDDDNFNDSVMGMSNFFHQQQELNSEILRRIKSSDIHICKNCYKGIIMMMHKFGKVNKTVKI